MVDFSQLTDNELNTACAKLSPSWSFSPIYTASTDKEGNPIYGSIERWNYIGGGRRAVEGKPPQFTESDDLCGDLLNEIEHKGESYNIDCDRRSLLFQANIDDDTLTRVFIARTYVSRRRALVEAYCQWKEARNAPRA